MRGVALIGCGAIGSLLAKSIDEGMVNAEILYLFDIDRGEAEFLTRNLKNQKPMVASSIDMLVEDLKVNLVVEAVSQDAVRKYIHRVIDAGKEFMVMSVGALLDPELKILYENFKDKIHIPSGAIAGVDAIKALRHVGIDSVELVTRKNPRTLTYASYVKKMGFDLKDLRKPLIMFEGDASEAVKIFPRSLNVAAILELFSGIPVHVKLIADPSTERNIYKIKVDSKASSITIQVENVPHPENPRTSFLAALSAVEKLIELCKK